MGRLRLHLCRRQARTRPHRTRHRIQHPRLRRKRWVKITPNREVLSSSLCFGNTANYSIDALSHSVESVSQRAPPTEKVILIAFSGGVMVDSASPSRGTAHKHIAVYAVSAVLCGTLGVCAF